MKSRQILKGQYDEIGTFLCNEYLKKHDLFKLNDECNKKVSDLMNEDMPDLVKQAYNAYPGYFELKKFSTKNLQRLFDYHTIDKSEKQINRLKYNYDGQVSQFWSKKREEVSDIIYTKMKEKGLEKSFSHYQPYHANIKIECAKVNKYGMSTKDDYDLATLTFFAIPLGVITESDGNNYYDNSAAYLKLVEYLGDHPAILDVIVDYMIEYGKYRQFCAQLSCAFTTITTTNMLKNEIPEAYKFFYDKYGKEYEEQDAEEAGRKKKEKKAQCDKIEALRASLS